ncbi:glycosyltransferase family 4 protein [Litorilituus lipolyticus]|nr:glycosyltransferase [Litorilituus lipolyticus]
MKTIILYDHFIAKGGAENVSLQLARHLSNSEIQTAYSDETLFSVEIANKELLNLNIKKNFEVPSSARLLWYFLFGYEPPKDSDNFIVSGLFAPLALFKRKSLERTIVYFHMFPSFINWPLKKVMRKYGFFRGFVNRIFIVLYSLLLKRAIKHSGSVFCNSKCTQALFAEIGIDCEVLYPPVVTKGLKCMPTKGYFLSTARIEHSKRIDIVLSAFEQLPQYQLKLVGGGSAEHEMRIKYSHCKNIEFIGWKHAEDVVSFYNNCTALVFIPENEAFGIAAVEAMAAGKAVIGVREAGLIDTLNDPRCGEILPLPVTIDMLKNAIETVALKTITQSDIDFRIEHANQFSEDIFYSVIKANFSTNNV